MHTLRALALSEQVRAAVEQATRVPSHGENVHLAGFAASTCTQISLFVATPYSAISALQDSFVVAAAGACGTSCSTAACGFARLSCQYCLRLA